MKHLFDALESAQIPAPHKNTKTCEMVRLGKEQSVLVEKIWRKVVFGDFSTSLNTYVFEKLENEYSSDEIKRLKDKAAKAGSHCRAN